MDICAGLVYVVLICALLVFAGVLSWFLEYTKIGNKIADAITEKFLK